MNYPNFRTWLFGGSWSPTRLSRAFAPPLHKRLYWRYLEPIHRVVKWFINSKRNDFEQSEQLSKEKEGVE